MTTTGFDYDVAVIGSGFGGSVTAMRLAEKGHRVVVLESGKRFTPENMPRNNWDLRNFYWFPRLGMRGMMRMSLLRDVFIVSGSAVGGGSVVYANTLYKPLEHYWTDRQWAHITDWRDELAAHYDQAERMLGVDETPFESAADRVMLEVADRMGVRDTYHKTRVGVFFGKRQGETVPDPYFGGEGPDRTGCIRCGACMTGCRHNAKNSLDRNYLYLAEKHGVEVRSEAEVVDLEPLGPTPLDATASPGYRLTTDRPGAVLRHDRHVLTAEQVVFSAGSLGTQKLLHRLRDTGRLPNLSERLGTLTRTNSEAILAAVARPGRAAEDYSKGIAITSSIHVDEHTHIEPVVYGPGSNSTGLLMAPLVDGGGRIPRVLRFLLTILLHPIRFLRTRVVKGMSERGLILLVMQSLDNSLRTVRRRTPFGDLLTTRRGHGEPNPTWIPKGNEAARHAADVLGGDALGSIFEATLNVPTTAHIIGGAPIGDSPASGVIDPYQRVYGHPGLHVVDGAAITANLGVNPSLSITALAERAMSLWPNRGEPDPRPPLGAEYVRVDPVAPNDPFVPATAPGALRRLPLVG